ncbi:OmpR/PhoB-type domain-containing protein [Mycobacterium sp. smrl_JER01]
MTPSVTPSAPTCDAWRFSDFTLDAASYELRRAGESIRVEPQVFDVLVHLVRNHRRVVTKNELFDTVWGGRFVGEAALTSRIKALRRALGDDGQSQHLIRTVRGRGYQFIGTLAAPEPSGPEVILNLGDIADVGGGLHFHSRRSRSRHRTRHRLAPSTRRREYHGPPR